MMHGATLDCALKVYSNIISVFSPGRLQKTLIKSNNLIKVSIQYWYNFRQLNYWYNFRQLY